MAFGLFMTKEMVHCVTVPRFGFAAEGECTALLGAEGTPAVGLFGPFALVAAWLDEGRLAQISAQGGAGVSDVPNALARASLEGVATSGDVEADVRSPLDDSESLHAVMTRADFVAAFLPLFARLRDAPEELPALVLGVMQQLPGWDFGYLGIVRQYLLRSPDGIGYPLYLAFFSLLGVVPDDPLLDNVILAADLWARSPPDCFQRVVRHWGSIAVNACRAVFQRPLAFTRMFKKFEALFGDRAGAADRLRAAFVGVLEEIGALGLGQPDIRYVFRGAVAAGSPRFVVDCLQLIERFAALCPHELAAHLHAFVVRRPVAVIVAAARAIHTLAPHRWQLQMTVVAWQVSERHCVFHEMLGMLTAYPGFLHALAALAIELGPAERDALADVLRAARPAAFAPLLRERFWFFPLVVIACQLPRAGHVMLFLARMIEWGGDIGPALDDFLDVVQALDALIDVDASVLCLDIFLAVNAMALANREIVLPRVFRFLFCRFGTAARSPDLLRACADSPFHADARTRRQPAEIAGLRPLADIFDREFAGCRCFFAIATGGEVKTLLQYCVQSAEQRSAALEIALPIAFAHHAAVRDERMFERLNQGAQAMETAHEAAILPRINAFITAARALFKDARALVNVNVDEAERAAREYAAAVSGVRAEPELPAVATVERYARHFTMVKPRLSKRGFSRYSCRFFIPSKLCWLDDLAGDPLFSIQTQPRPVRTPAGIPAVLWEFNAHRTVEVVIGDAAVEIVDVGRIVYADIITVRPRKGECIEIFTVRSGSFYLDFAPASASTLTGRLTAVGWKPAEPVLFARHLNNFDYLVILGLLAGRTFHVFADQPEVPVAANSAEIAPALALAIPEFWNSSVVDAYDRRRLLEHMQIEQYARSRFGDAWAARPAENTSGYIAAETVRALEAPEDDEIETGWFIHPDSVFVKMKSGRILIQKICEKSPAVIQPLFDGLLVPAVGALFSLDAGGNVEVLTASREKPPVILRFKGPIDDLRQCSTYFIFVSDTSRVCSSPIEKPDLWTEIVVTTERICTFEASENFGTCVVGTENCVVTVYSIANGEVNAVIDLEGFEPERVLVTSGWGVVVILIQGAIVVYSANGTFLGRIKLEAAIRNWKAFSSFAGFDYVVFVDETHRIGVFEAIKPGEWQYLHTTGHHNLVAVGFLPMQRAVVGLTKQGLIILSPIDTG
jgi:hypothetical protein